MFFTFVCYKSNCIHLFSHLVLHLCLCYNWQEGILSSEDIDKVMKDGMGPRYAFIGPLETMHLNADGQSSPTACSQLSV